MTQFQYFSNKVAKPTPIGFITLDRFIKAHREPKEDVKYIFDEIARCERNGDMLRKAELKQNNLHYFTPSVHLDGGRKYSDIVAFTGLMVLDFDHIDNAPDLKVHLFNEYKYIIASWLSPSRRGVKCLVSIPIVQTTDEFKEYFWGISSVMDTYDGFDSTTQNCVLPLFQSYDSELLYRSNYEQFAVKGNKPNQYNYTPVESVIVDTTDADTRRVYHNIRTAIERIGVDGHPQLRAASLSMGGYVASGYLTLNEAESFIHELIKQNAYLRKGIYGYCKTATWAINEGTKRQLTI